MSRLDYSKWDHIEVSDDEDDTHPNIDTPSLFRWRHQARVDRMAERKKEREDLEQEKRNLDETKKRLISQALQDSEKRVELEELKRQEEEWKRKEEELLKKEKSEPWNIDTLCHDGFSKSIINKDQANDEGLTEEEKLKKQQEFTEQYNKELKTYGMLTKVNDTQKYLQDHPHLICDKAANFLVIWCIDLEVEEKRSLMETVAHQTIILQFILELAKSLKRDPRSCYVGFFQKFQQADEKYRAGFDDELSSFKGRVKERAQIRIQRAMEEVEKEEREKRLGPGGLDPQEVFESLPKEMQDCFEKRNIPMLQDVIAAMDPEEAKIHMKRCVESGLWVPGGGEKKAEETDEMDLTLVHGSAKHKIDIESTASVEDLMEIVDRTTQIPTFNQKLIYKGISLKKDTGMSLHELGVKNNSKIMVIGQKHDPAEEAILKKMQGLQKSANDIREHVTDLRLNLDSVKKGFLEKSLVEKSAEQLKKRLLSCTEKGMKCIEVLDEIELHERHKDARAKRKQIINEIQAILDDCDKLADEIKGLVD